MDIEKVKTHPREERLTKTLSVRVSPKWIDFLKENHLSASKIFGEAIRELIEQVGQSKVKAKK